MSAGAFSASRRAIRSGASATRVEPARSVRRPRVACGSKRRELRAERAPGPCPARLLRHRLGAVRAPVPVGHARCGRACGERSARRLVRGRSDARSARPRAGGLVPASRRARPSLADGVPSSGTRSPPPRASAASSQRRRSTTTSASARTGAGSPASRSLLAIPVDPPRREEGGLVVVFFAEQRTFSDDDLELGRRLAGAAQGGPRAQRAVREREDARALSQQLARTGSLLATELDPAAIIEEVAEQAPALLGADACVIQLVRDEELEVAAVGGRRRLQSSARGSRRRRGLRETSSRCARRS